MSDLTTLRAEVERLRDDARRRAFPPMPPGPAFSLWANGENEAYDRVLDLIDKHTREGQ